MGVVVRPAVDRVSSEVLELVIKLRAGVPPGIKFNPGSVLLAGIVFRFN